MKKREISRKVISDIATQYSQSLRPITKKACEEYGFSAPYYESLLERAVRESIVDMDTVKNMRERAIEHSQSGAKGIDEENERMGRVLEHYARLLEERKTFVFSSEEAANLAKRYAKTQLPLGEFLKEEYITKSLLDRTLDFVIRSNLLDEKTARELRDKIKPKDEEATEPFDFEKAQIKMF